MNVTIIDGIKPRHGNLYNNAPNQIGRAVGRFAKVHTDERCGTVKGADGRYYDWWETEERTEDGWPVVKVVPAE